MFRAVVWWAGVLVSVSLLACSGASPESGPVTDILSAQPMPPDAASDAAPGAAGSDAGGGDGAAADSQAEAADGAQGDARLDAIVDSADATDGELQYPDAEEMLLVWP